MTERRADSELSRRQFLVASAASAALAGTAAAQPSPTETAAPPIPRVGEVLLRITVNGQAAQRAIDPRLSLLDLLREQLDVTSPKARLRRRHLR
jgi:xanthine dehydrogenase YagT iron-sulfur-binding subunit